MLRTSVLTTALLAALASPATAQDKAKIQKLNDQFGAAFNKGDAAGVAALYTEDAYLLPPGAEMAKGRTAVQNFWKAAAEQVGDMKLTTADVMPIGENAAQEIGGFTLRTKAQPPQEIAGKYVVIWRKVGADWSSRPTSGTPISSSPREPECHVHPSRGDDEMSISLGAAYGPSYQGRRRTRPG